MNNRHPNTVGFRAMAESSKDRRIRAQAVDIVAQKTRIRELEERVAAFEKMTAELKERVECPVCLQLPREDSVPCCPRGHITCSPCLENLRKAGRMDCPTCRDPMGEGKSLLAKVVIKNLEHECSFPGCDMKLPFNMYKHHQEEECLYRKVMCPGVNVDCQALVPFGELDQHTRSCEDVVLAPGGRFSINVPPNTLYGDLDWPSSAAAAVPFDTGCIFIRVNKEGRLVYIDTVLGGTKDECRRVTVELHILKKNSEEAEFKFFTHPR